MIHKCLALLSTILLPGAPASSSPQPPWALPQGFRKDNLRSSSNRTSPVSGPKPLLSTPVTAGPFFPCHFPLVLWAVHTCLPVAMIPHLLSVICSLSSMSLEPWLTHEDHYREAERKKIKCFVRVYELPFRKTRGQQRLKAHGEF